MLSSALRDGLEVVRFACFAPHLALWQSLAPDQAELPKCTA